MVKDLAVAVFGQEMTTHGLSERAGNANKGTTAKPALDQDKVGDIMYTITHTHTPYFKISVHLSLLQENGDDVAFWLQQDWSVNWTRLR